MSDHPSIDISSAINWLVDGARYAAAIDLSSDKQANAHWESDFWRALERAEESIADARASMSSLLPKEDSAPEAAEPNCYGCATQRHACEHDHG